MTALVHELGLDSRLLRYLEDHEMRYEVIDGCIVVSPPSGFRHEELVVAVGAQLLQAAPPGLAVLGSSYRFFYEPASFVMADLTVARRQDCLEHGTVVPPLLVVEILSSSTRRRDLGRKREIYEQAGVLSYWLIDPVAQTLTVLELEDRHYVESAQVAVGQPLPVSRPFPVTVLLPAGT